MSRTRALRRNRRATSVGPAAALNELTATIDNITIGTSTTFDVYLSTIGVEVDTAAAAASWLVWLTTDGSTFAAHSLSGPPSVSVVGSETRLQCEVAALAVGGYPLTLFIPVQGGGISGYNAQRLTGMSAPELAGPAIAIMDLDGP